jgi:ABC-type multidrug transport system permease subunit
MCGATARAEEAVAAIASGGGFLVARCLFGGFDARVRWSLWVIGPHVFSLLFYFLSFSISKNSFYCINL